MNKEVYSSAIISADGMQIATLVNVGMVIDIGLKQNKMNSKNTYQSYKSTIDDFCQFVFKCSHNQLTPQQISSINAIFTNEYINYLKSKGNANRTINQKISALKQMAIWLRKSGYDIDPFVFEPYAKIKSNTDNGYEAFEESEVYKMIDKAKEYKNGEIKSLLIRLAFDTAIRKNALLNLKRENFIKKDGKCFIWVFDKGNKKDIKPINEKLFDYILGLMGKFPKALLFKSAGDKRLPIADRTVDRLIDNLKRDLNIKNDNKKFHSIKKASVNRIARLSNNDFSLMKRHANHSNIETTIKYYYKSDKEDEMYYGIVQEYDSPDLTIIKMATRREIIDAIENASSRVQFEIKQILEKNRRNT